MSVKSVLINVGKFLLCVIAYMVGLTLGGMLVAALGLQQPSMPEGLDASTAVLYMMLESPLSVLVLIGLARFIAGSYWARTLMLAWFAWVTNSLNNQIEASYFGDMASGFAFNITFALVPLLLMAAAVAWFFPPASKGSDFASAAKAFFGRYSTAHWVWRLGVGALLFMPIYYFFGLLVIPFTAEFYRQGLYDLQVPPLNQLLMILFVRSVLFFLACLPILVAWQSSRRSLVLFLGLALTYFVGLQPLLIANWRPWSLRLPHILEIAADEFVSAWALVMLLGVKQNLPAQNAPLELESASPA